MKAAFFDLDKTVLRIDTGMSWMRFLRNRGDLSRLGLARAVYWSALYKAAVLDMDTLAQRLVADIAGDSEARMAEKCRIWYEVYVSRQVAPAARQAIDSHRRQGHEIVLLTASTQYAAEVVAASLDIEHILCSRLEVENGAFTGQLQALCYGRHKVTHAERLAGELGLDLAQSWFYSDSYTDLPMLERVGTAVAVNPDRRLRRHAVRTGWRIENWATP
jgi:HAD superfamily hydrolase (TIGR01490 family)